MKVRAAKIIAVMAKIMKNTQYACRIGAELLRREAGRGACASAVGKELVTKHDKLNKCRPEDSPHRRRSPAGKTHNSVSSLA